MFLAVLAVFACFFLCHDRIHPTIFYILCEHLLRMKLLTDECPNHDVVEY